MFIFNLKVISKKIIGLDISESPFKPWKYLHIHDEVNTIEQQILHPGYV